MSSPPLFAAILRHKVFRNALVYAGSGVARNAIPFLMLPVLTRYLSPSDFGIVATFEVILAVALVFIVFAFAYKGRGSKTGGQL